MEKYESITKQKIKEGRKIDPNDALDTLMGKIMDSTESILEPGFNTPLQYGEDDDFTYLVDSVLKRLRNVKKSLEQIDIDMYNFIGN